MKDEHNVILILVSSKWSSFFFLEVYQNSWFHLFIFLSGVQSYFNYIIPKIYLIIARIHLVFSTSLSSCYLFVTGVLHEGSTWWFHQGFNSFSKCSSRFFSEEFKHSSSCYLECNSFFHIIWGGVMSFLIIWVHVSWFNSCQEWDS